MEDVTLHLKRFFEILLLKRPVQTCLGGTLGFAIYGLVQLFGPALDRTGLVDRAAMPELAYVALGIVLGHIPTFFALFRRPSRLDEEIEQAFEAIERAKANGLPPLQVGMQCMDLVRKVQERVVYRKEIQDELRNTDPAKTPPRS